MANFTSLATLLNRMNRYHTLDTVEEQYKVRDLDQAIRDLKKETTLPQTLQKSNLRVFDDVLLYPTKDDHAELAFLTDEDESFSDQPRFRYTSIKEFYQNPTSRNDMAEIWDNGTKMIGIRLSGAGAGSTLLSDAEDSNDYTPSGDADSVEDDDVFFKDGNASIKVKITNNTGTATIKNTITEKSDTDYKEKYQFRWIYLDAVPDSIDMRLQTDDSNYLETNITEQFSGQALQADEWNLIAHDLNEATETGTFDENSINSEKVILNNAATGTYYLDRSHLREWELLDFWYYSENLIATVNSDSANQPFFMDSNGIYSTDSRIVGDDEWTDVILYEAMATGFGDEEDSAAFGRIERKRKKAWQDLFSKFPSLVPNEVTSRYNFRNDYTNQYRDDFFINR